MPSLPVLLVLCGAIVAAPAWPFTAHRSPAALAAGALLITAAAASLVPVYRRSLRDPRASRTANGARLLVLAALMAGAALTGLAHVPTTPRPPDPIAGSWRGIVEESTPRRRGAMVIVRVHRADRPAVSYRCMALTGPRQRLEAGDVVRYTAAPRRPADDGTPGGFAARCRRRGIAAIFYLEEVPIDVTPAPPTVRRRVRDHLARSCDRWFDTETAAMVKALYFGTMAPIDKETANAFRHAGLMHALAASGDHVSLIAAIPLLLLGLLRVNRLAALAVTTACLAAYCSITDLAVPLVRATIMFALGATYAILRREANPLNALCTAAAVMLAITPDELHSPGFQLSFGATGAIILCYASYRSSLAWLPGPLAAALAMAAAAHVAVFPLLYLHAGEINLIGFIAGLAVVPLIALMMLSSFVVQAVALVCGTDGGLGAVVDTLCGVIRGLARLFASSGGHFVADGITPVLCCAAALFLAPLVPLRRSRILLSLAALAGLTIAALHLRPAIAPPASWVYRHERGTLLVARAQTHLVVIGDLPATAQLPSLYNKINPGPHERLDLFITRPTIQNIAGFRYLADRGSLSRCFIADTVLISGPLRGLLRLLEQDGVPVTIGPVADITVREGNPLIRRSLKQWETADRHVQAGAPQTTRIP